MRHKLTLLLTVLALALLLGFLLLALAGTKEAKAAGFSFAEFPSSNVGASAIAGVEIFDNAQFKTNSFGRYRDRHTSRFSFADSFSAQRLDQFHGNFNEKCKPAQQFRQQFEFGSEFQRDRFAGDNFEAGNFERVFVSDSEFSAAKSDFSDKDVAGFDVEFKV